MFSIIKKLKKLNFHLIKTNKILIYGDQKLYSLKKILGQVDYGILSLNKEINFFVLCKMLIFFKFKKLNYLIFYIKKCNPDIIISCADNDINIFILKKIFPKIKFILIQNGRRGGIPDIFNNEFKKKLNKKYLIDFFFVFGEAIKKKYKEFVNAKYYCIGSIENNFYNKKKIYFDTKKILLISQYRPNNNFSLMYRGRRINHNYFYKSYLELLYNLNEFCIKNNIKLYLLPSRNIEDKDYEEEIFFIKKFFQNKKQKFKIKIIKKSRINNAYKIINKFSIIFGQDSTLCYEAMTRGKRVAYFQRFKEYDIYSFAWPLKTRKKGYFYTSETSINEIKRIYKNISIKNNVYLKKQLSFYNKNFMYFNFNNTKIKQILKKELNEKL